MSSQSTSVAATTSSRSVTLSVPAMGDVHKRWAPVIFTFPYGAPPADAIDPLNDNDQVRFCTRFVLVFVLSFLVFDLRQLFQLRRSTLQTTRW